MKRGPMIDDGGDYASDRALEDAAIEADAVRLTRRPDVERAAIYVGRLEDDVTALADVDLSAVALAPHADALESAWMTIAAVRAAVKP